MKSLILKNNALAKLKNATDFKTRKIIGNGLIMSSLSYIIQVYGGCSSYLLDMLQVQQNTAARHITKLPVYTSTKVLLDQCNWMSIRQLVMLHSLVLFHKMLNTQKLTYVYNKVKFITRETRTMDRLTIVDSKN